MESWKQGYTGTRIEQSAGQAEMSNGLRYHDFGGQDWLVNPLIDLIESARWHGAPLWGRAVHPLKSPNLFCG